uniref:Uncharacterized protein n=1 Tax=Anguilla anguilla TaxID=7936 RepID=A0A0E9PSX0_ANGAN
MLLDNTHTVLSSSGSH